MLQPKPQPQDYAADGTAIYKPIPNYNPNINGGAPQPSASMPQGSSEPSKRKRGRPRKYGPDATVAASPFAPASPAARAAPFTPAAPAAPFTPAAPATPFAPAGPAAPVVPASPATPAAPPAAAPPAGSSNPVKNGRGRPRGSSTKKPFKGSGGVSITPHVITVKAGEDLSSKIMSLSLNGPRNICVLTANGAISNATLRQPAKSGGVVTYEGRYEILTLGGSLLFSESGGQPRRYGGLNVSLSAPDGRVMGGGVAGLLVAASPVQVVLASFTGEDRKVSNLANLLANQMGNLSAPPKVATAGQSSSASHGTRSESSGGPGSPLNPSTGTCNNNNPPQGISGMH